MNKLIVLFVSFLIVFLPVPILGVYTQGKIFSDAIFNYSYSLYLLGISSNENRSVIGDNGWLFLGNGYESVMDRSKESYEIEPEKAIANEDFINKISVLSGKAGSDFIFVVVPNKHSIYGENVGLNSTVGTYSYYSHNARSVRSDMVSYLRRVRERVSNDLYFKTDTHWNSLGAFYGYQYVMEYSLNDSYERIPYDVGFESTKIGAGDLARFLNVTDFTSDENFSMVAEDNTVVVRTDLISNEVREVDIQGDINNAEVQHPIKVVNKDAYNDLKVLWLHDSFGGAMSPYMHLTFREVTHQHYYHALNNLQSFQALVESISPDIIIVSPVERASLHFWSYL